MGLLHPYDDASISLDLFIDLRIDLFLDDALVRAPKRIYWLEILSDENSVGLGYRQKGGGKFTDLKAAKDRQAQLLRNTIRKNWMEPSEPAPIKSKIYQSQLLEWSEINEDES
jgi:hypothetical protein